MRKICNNQNNNQNNKQKFLDNYQEWYDTDFVFVKDSEYKRCKLCWVSIREKLLIYFKKCLELIKIKIKINFNLTLWKGWKFTCSVRRPLGQSFLKEAQNFTISLVFFDSVLNFGFDKITYLWKSFIPS